MLMKTKQLKLTAFTFVLCSDYNILDSPIGNDGLVHQVNRRKSYIWRVFYGFMLTMKCHASIVHPSIHT